MRPDELRQRAAQLEREVQAESLGTDDEHGAAALLAALAEWDVPTLRRALLGVTGDGNAGEPLLRRAVEIAEDEQDN